MGKLFFSRGRGAWNDWETNGAKYKVISEETSFKLYKQLKTELHFLEGQQS